MKLEIEIPSIIYNDAKENRNYISVGKTEIAWKAIADGKPLEQEPKTGRWKYGYAFPDGNYCKCSECKEIIKCIYPMHYCPNCGCRMFEPRESEEV